MPENARVFIAEDKPQFLEAFGRKLSRAGHVVVLTATSLAEALDAIKQFERLKVQVAVIDGNLSPNDESGYDGRALVAAINRLPVSVKTVGMSNSKIEGVTVDLEKGNYPNLAETVTNL